MNPEDLVGSLLVGALASRGKRSHRAARFLTGGRGSFLNASTLVSAAAVAWGLYEASQSSREREARSAEGAVSTSPPPEPPAAAPAAPAPEPKAPETPAVPDEIARIIRLMVSAARADGDLSPEEGQQIARRASDTGAEELVRAELQTPWPLAEIVAGVTDEKQRFELYTLAFSIVRADESVSGAERIYLAQLAKHLGLDPAAAKRLDEEAAAKIDSSEGEPNA